MIRVVIADDQDLVREGLCMMIGAEDDIEVVAEAGTGAAAVKAAREHDPDVLLMDVRMPEMDGIEATARLVGANVRGRVLMLTTFDLDEYVYRAMKAGASGFLLKDATREQLTSAVRTVAAGEALLAPPSHDACSKTSADAHRRPPGCRPSLSNSPLGSSRYSACSRRACPMPRSPHGCSSATRLSKAT